MTFGTPVRSRFQAPLGTPPPPAPGIRLFAPDDVPALAALMWDAYRGTPDESDVGDASGAVREVGLTLNGEYGTFLPSASFVAEPDERPVAGALVTLYRDVPLLAFLFVAPSHSSQGLGQALVKAVMHALSAQGHDTLSLAVTRRNHRARRLYDRLGFIEVA